MFAQTPVLLCDVLVKNLSDHVEIELEHFHVTLTRQGAPWQRAAYEVRQVPARLASELPLHVKAKHLAIYVDTPAGEQVQKSRLLNYNETWISPTSGDGDVSTTLAIRNFYEYYPCGVRVEPNSATFELWPDWWERPWRLRQGAGKTHELAIGVTRDGDALTPAAIGTAVGKPPMPRVALADQQIAGVNEDLLDYEPDRYPRIETTLYDLVHNRNRGYGKMHWGDDYSALYTNQLRGVGEIVWNNLEGDLPYHLWRQFQRTGRYQYFKQHHDALLHWADVDFLDRATDPMNEGALSIHVADHTLGAHTCPSHNWSESFVEWYFATGNPRPREIIDKMVAWLVRQAEAGAFSVAPEPYVRRCGWGLIQMAALQQVVQLGRGKQNACTGARDSPAPWVIE
jgi:hypothetical protein